MAKCIKCGVNEIWNKRTCKACIDKWIAKRLEAWSKVVVEIGEPTFQNKKEFDKRLKKYERE
jgi:hypothetical protein